MSIFWDNTWNIIHFIEMGEGLQNGDLSGCQHNQWFGMPAQGIEVFFSRRVQWQHIDGSAEVPRWKVLSHAVWQVSIHCW